MAEKGRLRPICYPIPAIARRRPEVLLGLSGIRIRAGRSALIPGDRIAELLSVFCTARSGASIMSRGTRQLALITRGIGRRRETRHSVASRIHTLRVHRVVWHCPLRGGVLPADRLGQRCTIVTDAGTGLRAGGRVRHKPKQCHRRAGTPGSSATAAIPIGGV